MRGSLIRRVDAGEVEQLSAACFFIKTLHIALFSDFQRCVHVDFDEPPGSREFARSVTPRTKRRNGGDEDNHADVVEETSQFADSTDIFRTIGVTESEIAVQAKAKRVAVEVVHEQSLLAQSLLDDQGHR